MSVSEDPIPFRHNSKTDPIIRSRPLSDIYPFPSQRDRSAVPYLLSGCSAQLQPRTVGPDESRLNSINSSAWSNPVIAHPEGNPHPSRIMRLFSNSKKGPVPAHSPTTDGLTTSQSNNSNSSAQPWSGLSGLGVLDSFKKLRSSVLHSIQSRELTNKDGENIPSSYQEMANGTTAANTESMTDNTDTHHVSNGGFTVQMLGMMNQYSSDTEDYDDEENYEGSDLTRNSRFSRSIRKAYGAGRISLFDTANRRITGRSSNESSDPHTSKINVQAQNTNERVNVMNRLSKSAENLHIFKAPFRRKVPSPCPPDPRGTITSNMQRTASASSVDLRAHTASNGQTPVKTKPPMLKLVGSMTDLTVRRKRSPSQSPSSASPMSPLSRLHDDYSRRVPCLKTSERRRRPSPVRAQVMSVEHTPLVHHQAEFSVSPQQHMSVSVHPLHRTEQTSPATATECSTAPPMERESIQQEEQVNSVTNEVREYSNLAGLVHKDERSQF